MAFFLLVRNSSTSVSPAAAADTLSDLESEDEPSPTAKDSLGQKDTSPPRYNSKGLLFNANGVVSMRKLDLTKMAILDYLNLIKNH